MRAGPFGRTRARATGEPASGTPRASRRYSRSPDRNAESSGRSRWTSRTGKRLRNDLGGIEHRLALSPMESLHRLEHEGPRPLVDAKVPVEVHPLASLGPQAASRLLQLSGAFFIGTDHQDLAG